MPALRPLPILIGAVVLCLANGAAAGDAASAGPAACVGDCNGDRLVSVDEVVLGVAAALGAAPPSHCASFDADHDGRVTMGELLMAVNGLLLGCRGEDPRPNVVVIMTDDLDVASTDRMLDAGLMPNLWRYLVDGGMTFTQSFVSNSLCAPSRATFLTGQYPHNHLVRTNLAPMGSVLALDDHSTLGTWLHQAGYRTGLVGKYLNGYGVYTDAAYVPPGWDDWQALVDPSTYVVYDYVVNDNGRLQTYGDAAVDYQTDVLAQRAARFIMRSAGTPFFLWVTPLAPHFELLWPTGEASVQEAQWALTIRPAPRHAGSVAIDLPRPASFDEVDVSDKPSWLQADPPLTSKNIADLTGQYRDRLTALRAVDDLIGTVVEALQRIGELERTVLIFTSDNGWLSGEHRLSGKQCAYEECIRVPLFIRAPHVPGGQVSEELVVNNDLAPTIAAFAGAAPGRPFDGRSIVPLLADPARPEWRRRFAVEHLYGASQELDPPTYVAVRTGAADVCGAQVYVEYDADPGPSATELYDLTLDPMELNSLHADPGPARAQERASLAGWVPGLSSCAEVSCQALEDEPGAVACTAPTGAAP